MFSFLKFKGSNDMVGDEDKNYISIKYRVDGHYFYYYYSAFFYWGGFKVVFGYGNFFVWVRMNIALSRYFLLIKTESNFFSCGKILITKSLKLATDVSEFP